MPTRMAYANLQLSISHATFVPQATERIIISFRGHGSREKGLPLHS